MPEDHRLNQQLVELAQVAQLEYVATNNVHYADQASHRLQDILVAIRHNLPLDENPYLRRNAEYFLKSGVEMAQLFETLPRAISNTCHIAERCQFDLRYGLQDLPVFPTPAGITAETHLRQLTMEGLKRRFGVLSEAIGQQLDHELGIISRAGLANYFLIVWDIVHFAVTNGIRCQGRGSAANSLVAYALGISPIDPLAHDLSSSVSCLTSARVSRISISTSKPTAVKKSFSTSTSATTPPTRRWRVRS